MSMFQVVLSTRREGKPCEACGAPLVWYRTKQGKQMPCNADAKPHAQQGFLGPPEYGLIDAKYSHFATCPKADQFRRGRP